MDITKKIAFEQGVKEIQVKQTLKLLEEGCSVPFISRYRKEATGALDEEQIRIINEAYTYQTNLEKRKEDVARLIEVQGKLSEEIKKELMQCNKLSEVEDIYRPYKLKKKTRASEAIKHGLQPLADELLACPKVFDLNTIKKYFNKDINDEATALSGAKDIIAEIISDDNKVRNKIYDSLINFGRIKTTLKKNAQDEFKVYRMYYDRQERVSTIANHRIMAIERGEKAKILNVKIITNDDYLLSFIEKKYIKHFTSPTVIYLKEAINDGYKRLALPQSERLVRNELFERASEASVDLFSLNLEKLLMIPPIKDKIILGFDPAYRTGCKLAVIDQHNQYLGVDVIYPHKPVNKVKESSDKLVKIINDYHVDLIAIGNGTASRESERFVANVISEHNLDVAYTMVSEAGASVYSASKLAIEEFPNLHVEQRSAISIARRLSDPLSELIKIDPEAIGVGQYQHDLPTKRLSERLDFVVSKCVNKVGVNINTASISLLKNIAGLNNAMATSIVNYRTQNGSIKKRSEIKKISKIGPKAYEQAAGFLRIEDGDNPLDKTSIHPESYAIAKKLLKIFNLDALDLGTTKAQEKINQSDLSEIIKQVDCDEYTFNDIIEDFKRPLRDYREGNDGPILRKDVLEFEDVKIDDEFEGIVRNIVDFGVFVDIGLHDDGLIHISKLSRDSFNHPSDIMSVGDKVRVWVCGIDEEKHKIQLRAY